MEMHAEAGPSASATGSAGTSGKTPQELANILAVGEAEISHQPRILSLDGGGVRGLSSLVILREIMEEVQRQAKLKETPRPCDYFDLIGGTSTGGLIAIMLGRLKIVRGFKFFRVLTAKSIEECIDQYMKLSEEVFNRDHTVFGVLPTGEKGYRFDSAILEQVIQGLMDTKLKDQNASMAETDDSNHKICRTFVVATSAAVAQGPLILFRSYDTHENNASKCAIWKAARATSAAPSFFDPVFINVPAPGAWYVDGGLRYNNPAQVALDEARQCWPRIKRFSVLSIGTGQQTNVEFVNIKDIQPPKEMKASKGLFTKVMSKVPGRNVIINAPGAAKDMLHIGKACVELSTSSEPTHEAIVTLANSKDPHYRFPYYRFNVENGMDSIGLEEWKANVRIGELTEQYMRKRERQMDKFACAGNLINPAPVERT